MNHCRDCKHWRPDPSDNTLRDEHPCALLSQYGGFGYSPDERPERQLAHARGHEDADLYTDAEFGCVHHEPAPGFEVSRAGMGPVVLRAVSGGTR